MIEQAFLVVEAEQQRSDDRLFFKIAKTSDDAIGGALAFDFLHAGALTALVGQVEAFGDDSVERGAHLKPFAGFGEIFGDWGETNEFIRLHIFAEKIFQVFASFTERQICDRMAFVVYQEIENDVGGRRELAEFCDAAGGGMYSLQKRVERYAAIAGDDDFAVENEALCLNRRERGDELGKISSQRLLRL